MAKTILGIVLSFFLAAPWAIAQSSANEYTLVRAGKLVDVRSGRVLTDQGILIEGNLIKEVGPADQIRQHAPGGVRIIDLSNKTVLPGLIDCHTHLTFDPTSLGYEALGISIPREALIGARNARVTLEAGFTTVRNVG